MSANADDEVSIAERYSIDHAMAKEPAFAPFDREKATATLDTYIHALRQEGVSAKNILYNKVKRVAGDKKKSRTLMRVAYLIVTADREIRDGEMEEFVRLSELLNLEPDQIWGQLSASSVQRDA